MIFLVIVFFIVAIVGSLSYIDNANEKTIDQFLAKQGCHEINYTRGYYQALCKNKLVIVKNQFKLELNKADIIYYNTVKNVKKNEEKHLHVKTDYETLNLKFKDQLLRDSFYKKFESDRIINERNN